MASSPPYISSIPLRLSCNPDNSISFDRMRGQCDEICEPISGNYDGSGGIPNGIAAARWWSIAAWRLKFFWDPPHFDVRAWSKWRPHPLIFDVYLFDYPVTRVRQCRFTVWEDNTSKYVSWYQAIRMALEVCRNNCSNEILKRCILTTDVLLNPTFMLTSEHIQNGVLTSSRRPC
jgi:hypothetical protein